MVRTSPHVLIRSGGPETDSIDDVHESELSDDLQDRTYLAAKEIYTTEKAFNQILHYLYVDFREHILELEILPVAEFEKIFSNIVQIRVVSDALLKELEERIENWDVETSKIADILVRVGPFLK